MKHVILGASGQVGSAVVTHLLERGEQVKAVIRDPQKAPGLAQLGAEIAIADIYDSDALTAAVTGADTFFVLTPESGKENDVIGEMKTVLDNYRKAAEAAAVPRIVGLSSSGAQHASGTGYLRLSYLLEHTFNELPAQTVFIRPAYYFSNWLGYLEPVKKDGILPAFFPPDRQISMVAPADVAAFIAKVLAGEKDEGPVYELEGPEQYTVEDVAAAMSGALNKPVKVSVVPREQWEEQFRQAGFSPDGVRNFVEMTEAVVSGRAGFEKEGTVAVKGSTSLGEYMNNAIRREV